MNLNDMGNGKNFTRFQNFLKVVFVFILFALPIKSIAQYDYEHYVPPFYCSAQVGKQEIFLSTNSEKELTVYVEDGQGKSIAGPFTISRTKSETYIFETSSGATYSTHSNSSYPDGCSYSYGIIGPKELNKPLDGHGLRIYSYDGPFFANIRHGFSNDGDGGALTHGFSLSAKGATAQGTDFYSGHLYNHTILHNTNSYYSDPYYYGRYPVRGHSISVMAVEEGSTTVTFSGLKCKYITKYESGSVKLVPITSDETISVDLTKGQSYTLAVNLYGEEFHNESIEVRNGMNGTHITSSQKIVVNSGSWTAGAKPSQDMGFDQIVPVEQVRDKYIVMKGEGRAEPNPSAYHAGQERTIVVATQENTEVWVNEVNKGTLANPGDFMILDDIVNPSAIPTLYINTKGKDVYVYQTMCGTDEDWINIGLNFIPPLTVLGMKEVVIPSAEQITSGDYIYPTVTILAQKNVDVEFNGTPLTNPHDVTGTTEWVYFDVSGISGDCRFAGNKAINVAWTASSNTLGAAGYYSGFTRAVSPIHPELDVDTDLGVICESYDDNIVVSVKEPEPDFYEWYINNFEGDAQFPNSPLNVEAPDVETSYYVIGYYRDPSLDILFNGDFLDGYNGFNSEYELVTKNLTEPGKFAITGRPKDENALLNDFPPLSGWKMFLGYSDNQGDVVYQVDELEVESEFNYIFKMYGRLAQDESANDQSLRVLVNDETIITDFTINSSNEWQSSSALWSPGDARKASIKILNNNLDSQDAFFAIDSISFVQAVQDTAVFVAKVVPNISTIKDTEYHFCEGTPNSLDVSNGETSWYDYSWSKKDDETGEYIKLVNTDDIFGVDSCVLTFNDPKQIEEGTYRCTIGFNEDYQRCGPDETLDVDLEVFVDLDANVRISGASHTCMNSPVTFQALVEGDQEILKWYVDGADEPVYVSKDKEYSFPAETQGMHTIRCEAENGCGLSFAEVQIEVLAYPKLTALNVADHTCVGADVSLEALATVEGTSNLKYYWYKGVESLDHNESTYSFTSSLDDQGDVYSVAVSNTYTVGDDIFECRSEQTLETDPLNIIPEVNLTPLSDATLCEGEFHEFKAEVGEDESNYEFKWKINNVLTDNKTSAYAISSVSNSDVGAYKVVVWNECFTEKSTANLAIKPKIKVYGIDFDAAGPFCLATNVSYTFNVEDNGAAYEYKIIDPKGNETITTQTGTFLVDESTQGEWQFIVNGECGEDPFVYKQSFWLIPDFGNLTIDDVGTCLGENINFYAKVDLDSDLSELTYLWKNSAGTELGTEATLPINNVQESDLGTYSCTVSDGCHEKTESAVLSIEKVNTNPDLAEITLCVGESLEIAIDYVGTPEFEWRFNDPSGSIINSTNTFKIPSVSKTDEGIYYCKVKLICGTSVTVKRKLIVNEHINVADVSDLTIDICQGDKPELTINVTGETDNYSVLWTDGADTPLDGFGDVNTIQLPAHNTVGSFTYKAIVNGNCEDFEKKYIVQVHEKPILKAVDNDMLKCSGLVELNITESGEHDGISWWKNGSEIFDGNSEPTDFVINPATSPDDDGTYIAKVSSKYCGPAQASIKLDIINTIELKEQSPALTEVCESNNVTLFVKADGDDIQYKWTHTAYPSKTFPNSPSIELKDVTSANDEGEYTCELSNDLGCGNPTATFNVIVNENPSISNPEDQTICETTTSVNFKVKGSAEGDENYQWYKNDVLITGATSRIYTENSPANGSTYYCTVTGTIGDCGTAISDKATLTIIKEVSVTDPIDQYIADGADATFNVKASGEPEYSYQWQIWVGPGVDDWLDISDVDKYSGTKTTELKITNADKATYDGKQYRCVVLSSGKVCNSSATSNEATLHINTVVKIAAQPENQTVCEGENAIFEITGKISDLTYTWEYSTDGVNFNSISGESSLSESSDANGSELTISPAALAMNSWSFRCLVSDGSSTDEYSNEVSVRVLKDIDVSTANASFNPCLNKNFSLSVEATGDDIKFQWYKDDVIITGATKATYNFGNIALVDEATYKCEVYNDEHCNDITRTFIVDVKEPATVNDPDNVVMCETDVDPKFTVIGGGDGISYQWYKNNVAISGATSASYTETDPKDGNTYSCEVSNTCTTVKSKSAVLTVVKNLETTDPKNLTIADGANATFSVVASGEPNYTYQWQVWNGSDWDNISDIDKYSGTQTAELTITNADKATYDGKQYRCIVYSDGGICISEVTSGKATLTINTVVKIAADATNAEVCFGDDETLSVTGTSDALAFTWEYNKGSGWIAADGQDGMSANKVGAVSTLTVPGTDLGINSWEFRCLVSDGSSTDVYSNTVTVRVLEDIVVSTIDENFTPCLNDAFALSVVTTAGDDIKFQWYKDDVIITGATKATYNFGNIAFADEATYKCKVYNDEHCNDITRTFIVDVKEPATVNDPVSVVMCETDVDPKFTVIGGGDGISYQWYKNNVAISGATSASYTETDPKDGNTYSCEVSNTCTTVKSKSAVLTVVENLETTDPKNLTIADGANATFSVVASGEPNYTYQWQVWNGSDWDNISDIDKYSGTQTAELTITNADKATYDGKQYQCVVYSDGGICISEVTSGIATLTITAVDKILNQPKGNEVCNGEPTKITIEGTVVGHTYIWEYDEGDGSGYKPAVGNYSMTSSETGKISTLSIPNASLAMNSWLFRCLVSDASSTDVYSNTVTVRVLEDIVVSTIDENFTPCLNDAFALSVVTTAGDDIKFQWYKDDVIITGATKATYNFGNIALADEATYKCEIYNDEHCNDITRIFIVDVKEPATVNDPDNVVMCETDVDPKFTVIGGGDGISYQWYKNNVAISGATSVSYTETDPKDGNTYYCEVSNTCETVKSKSAVLTVVKNLETTDPKNLTIADGANATFSVVASGEPNYTYQWQVWNGSDWDNISDIDKYSGTQTAELTIINADKATYDGKQYRCIVYSDGGICISEVTSGKATLTINTVVKIAADASNAEVCFGDDASLTVTGTSDALAFTWEYNKGSGWIAADGQDGMSANKAGVVSTLTVPGTDLGINSWEFRCLVSDGSSTDVYSNTVTVRVLEDIAASAVLANQSICENESVTMEVTATGDDKLYKWYKDSEPLAILSTASSYRIDNVQPTINEGDYTCEVYNLQGCNDQTVHFTIDVKEFVAISDLSDIEMCPSQPDPVFKVKVSGDTPYGFQWYNSAGAISGATSDTYTETNPVDGETYYCELTNDCNTITSNTAILTVYEEAKYTSQPISISILDGDDAEFNVDAAGEEPLAYQWQEDSGSGYVDITDDATYSGSNTANLKITKANLTFNGNKYRCLLSNICTTDLASAEVDLQVLPLYKILTQPANLQACLNDEVFFEIVGTDTDTPYDYEWEYNDGSGTFVNAEGVLGMEEVLITNGSQLKISSVSLDMRNWTFHCIVKDGISENDTSNEVAIEVFEPVSFDLIDDQNLCAEESMQISLSGLTGTTPISYSWTKDATEVSTTAIVTIGEADNGNYEVTAGNGVCPDFTDDFVVSHYSKLSIEAWSNTDQLCIGEEETLTATVNVDPALAAGTSYEWFKDEISLGVTTADYKLTATSKDQSGMYKLVVFDGCNTETVSGYIDIYEPIKKVDDWLSKETLCVGEELSLEVNVSGDAVDYTWTKDGDPITATTNYLVTKVTTDDAGTYKCVVTDHCGIELTYTIEITILSIPEITDGIEDLPAICEGDALQLGPINIKGTYGAITWTLNDASEDTSSGLSLILGAATSDMEGNYKVAVTNICGTVASIGTQVVNPIPAMEPIADQTVCQGEDVIFSAKATGRDVHYHWKIDGEDQATSLSVLLINGMNVLPADEFTQRIYTIECSVTNDNGCGETLVETAQLIVNPTTILKETLKDVVKYVGDDYTMSLDVTGTDLSYEWTHEKTDGTIEVLGVDAPTIEFTNIDLSDAGYYSCIITGTCGTRIASGTLTVKVPVKIVEDLADLEIKCEGDALRLLIVTSGQVEAIKWFKEVGDTRTELTETGSSLYFSELSLDDAATYTCEITGEGIDVIKQSCIVRVYPTTRLNAPIGNQELCEGEMLDWSPDVTGAADLSYTWSFEGNPVSTDKNLHYDVLDLLQEGEYQVQVTGLCGDVSSSGYLEITELPEIISVSENAEVCENFALVEFIVKATGENVKYQWRKNGTDIEGKTSPILSLTSIQLDDDAIYTCRVYNDCAEVISADMKLTVKPQLVILSEPADIEVCSGEDVTFTAEVEGIDVTYQWQVNGVDIPGETNSVYSITNTDESHNGYYTCVVSDECTSSRSTKPAKLTVNALPNTAIFGRMVLCAKEDRVTYITNQYGDDVYGWGVEGGIFAGPEEGTKTRVTWSEAKEGMLSISITDMNTGCESKVDSLVVLNALPTVKLAKYESKGICEESFELSGGYPEGGIYWVDGISEEVFDPADKGPGNYTVHYSYTDENGCSNITETTNLRVDTLPVVDITDDITVGSCKPFELSAKTDEGNISWSPADNLDDAYSMKPIFTPGESQVLVATVVDEHGCKGVDLVEINVAPLPEVTTIADTTVGQCNQLQLSTEIIGDAGEITWTNSDHLDEPDSKDPRIINAPEGTYTYKVNVVDLYGCDASDEVTVKMVADPVLEESKFACEGEKFEVDVTGMQNPFWSNSDWNNEERNEINNLDVYTVKTPGKYKLEVSNEYGCGAVQNFTINPTPKIELSNNLIYSGPDAIEILEDKPVVIFEGQSLTLGTNLPLEYSPYFYTWQDGSILPKFEVSETGKYILRVEDNLGCFAVDSLNIEVKPVGIESPSAFTPNSTNENNRFYLKKINYDFEKYEMYVYDRWGELLYKTNEFGYNGGWDGKYKGKLCPSGAYVWMVFINGELTNKGTVMLLR